MQFFQHESRTFKCRVWYHRQIWAQFEMLLRFMLKVLRSHMVCFSKENNLRSGEQSARHLLLVFFSFLRANSTHRSSIELMCDLISGLVKTAVNCDQTASLWGHLPNKRPPNPEVCSPSCCQPFIPSGVLLRQESIFTSLVMLFTDSCDSRGAGTVSAREGAHSQGLWLCGTSTMLVVWNLKYVEEMSVPRGTETGKRLNPGPLEP